jgi:para-nitrobenzyl esterase
MCAQAPALGTGTVGSEDCLTLNVWTPSSRGPSASLPVLVFIYGGGFELGSSNEQLIPGLTGNLYDGRTLAETQKVVVVTYNYRLAALGFLAHPALSAESPNGASGNYGLLDGISALKWVQRNARAFGGDPSRVMLFGESAGAISTCSLLASPLAHGLFSSALMESGWCAAAPLTRRYTRGQHIAQAVGCAAVPDVAACLRAVSVDSIVQADGSPFGLVTDLINGPIDLSIYHDLHFGPTVDGYVLPDAPLSLIAQGKHNHVPVVMGSNSQEGAMFALPWTITSCSDYSNRLALNVGALAPEFEAAFPCNLFDPTAHTSASSRM